MDVGRFFHLLERHTWLGCAVLTLLIASSPFGFTQANHDSDERRYKVLYVEAPPVVDGDLSDPIWRNAAVITDFTQQLPVAGGAPSQKTELRLVYDRDAIYAAVYCYDSDPSTMQKSLFTYRDDELWRKDDAFQLMFDTYHDHRRAFAFSVTPRGTRQDGQIDQGVWFNVWDEVWEVRTRLKDDGWTAEYRIPLRILRFPLGGDQPWGFNAERLIKRTNERVQWAPIPSGVGVGRAEYWGHLEGLSIVEQQRNIQTIPYVTAGVKRERGRDAEYPGIEVGVDAKTTLTPTLAMDLTYNTNFAQVEADDRQVNLTRFPLFFPEKREFFLENAQMFEFGILQELQLFFSRRIGLEGGQPIPLLGGARLTGRAGPFDVGLLTTQTESHQQNPSTNLSTARVRWNVGRRSRIGGIFTSVSSDASGNRAFGPDMLLWLGRYLSLESFLAVIDDRKLKSHPAAFASALVYNQDRWGVDLRTLRVDEGFNPALGFVRRTEILGHEGKLRRGWRFNRKYARKIDLFGQYRYTTDLDGLLDARLLALEAADELDSGDIVRLRFEGSFERLDPGDEPFLINPRKNIIVPPGDYGFNRWIGTYESFWGRAFSGKVQLQGGSFFGGDRTGFLVSSTWRVFPQLTLAGDYELNDVGLPQGSFTTSLWRARFAFPIRPRLLTDGLIQWDGLNRDLATQVRFHLIYGEDSNLFVVFSDARRDINGTLLRQNQELQFKLTYRKYW